MFKNYLLLKIIKLFDLGRGKKDKFQCETSEQRMISWLCLMTQQLLLVILCQILFIHILNVYDFEMKSLLVTFSNELHLIYLHIYGFKYNKWWDISVWPIDGTLTSTTPSDQSESGSDGIEGVTPHSPKL